MKGSLLYPRVSSDEQSEKGFSLRDQEEKLTRYCHQNGRMIHGMFSEDYSAWKGFNRPAWNKLLSYIKTHRGEVNEVLFINWTRFSRNTPEAYAMIKILKSYGITPNAIEQPLDFNIPESKIMLAVYLSVAEADNDRRSINTIAGVRKAQHEGNYHGKAPIGYLNAKSPDGKSIIIIDTKKSHLIKEIFQSYLNGKFFTEIHREMREKGFDLKGREAVKRVLLHSAYAGLLTIKAYGDESVKIIKGKHEPIIDENTYWSAKSRYQIEDKPCKKVMKDELPLRGVLFCEACGQLYSGSRSRGKSGDYYWYYRCCHGCKGENYYSVRVHNEFSEMMSSISLSQSQIYKLMQKTIYHLEKQMGEKNKSLTLFKEKQDQLTQKLQSVNDKYISDKIDHTSYVQMKLQYTSEAHACGRQIQALSQDENKVWELFQKRLPMLGDLNNVWEESNLSNKQVFLRALFPGSLSYQKNKKNKGCNDIPTSFATPFLFEPFLSNADNIKHLTIKNGSKVRLLSNPTPTGVDDGT